jgi:membrane protease subunit HflC
MANRLPIFVVAFAVLLFLAWSSIFVVNEREQAIVLRFGEIVDVKTEPGLYFKAPFAFAEADNVQIIEDRVMRFDLDDIRVQVSGGKFYEVDAYVAYRIADPALFRQTVSGSIPLAEQRLRTRLDAALRRVYGLRGFEAALSEERASMMREVAEQLRPAALELGIEITDVRIKRTDLTDEVSQQTYQRMQAERLAEAERLRARGREAAQRIRARADREVVEILAEAQRESEILRGEGEAERNAIFADAFQRDPEFFEFYRSMAAYEEALQDTGTTMLLSPDSQFFRYFGNSTGAASGPEGEEGTPPGPRAPSQAPAAEADTPEPTPGQAGTSEPAPPAESETQPPAPARTEPGVTTGATE